MAFCRLIEMAVVASNARKKTHGTNGNIKQAAALNSNSLRCQLLRCLMSEQLTRQQLRARSRQYDKAIEKMEKLEASTKRLIELGAIKRKGPVRRFFQRVFGGGK